MENRNENIINVIYLISVIFITSGAVNFGFTRYYLAIPFMIVAFIISLRKKNRKLMIVTLILCLSAIVINYTLEKNPVVFPILSHGSVTILADGYITNFGGNTYYFMANETSHIRCIGCGITGSQVIKKGSHYPVTGITISYPEFETQIDLITPIGIITQKSYKKNSNDGTLTVQPNKTVVSPFFEYLSLLMLYPIILFKLV